MKDGRELRMNRRVLFEPDHTEISVPAGTLLSDAARLAGVFIDAPCGGRGVCGKCAVTLVSGGEARSVLACRTRVSADCTVRLPDTAFLRPLSEGASRSVPFEPYAGARADVPGACFAAFDLGTTTIVCYLLDAGSGDPLAVRGMQNPQSAFGADVISRASHALSNGYEPLRTAAAGALNELLQDACAAAGRKTQQVVLCSVVGNTVMHHLLLGYPVDALVRAPYRPYRADPLTLAASALGLSAHKSCVVLLPPVIGGFVGSDTVACMTATAFDESTVPTLLMDIGTNGELALTDGTRRACCSTAAGPAFEGANLSCGMRASRGAIDRVRAEDGKLCLSTVENAPPAGLCGSGLLELAALLVSEGVIDESGRLQPRGALGARVTDADGQKAFLLFELGTSGVPLLLTQRDVRELQLAKAALRAGIELLCESLSLPVERIERVLLAGAFGSRLSPAALGAIGLLPRPLVDRTESIGNAAGEGAKLYLRSRRLFETSEPLARGTAYLELTSAGGFTDRYVDAMSFPSERV